MSKTTKTVGINFDGDAQAKLQAGAVFRLQGKSLREAYNQTIDLYFSAQDETPSVEQYRYWTDKVIKRGQIC